MNTPSVVECVTRRSKHRRASAFGLLKPGLNPPPKIKTNYIRLNRSLFTSFLTGLTLLSLTGGSVHAAHWTITDLGALGAPGNALYESRAYHINNAGQVAGVIEAVVHRPFLRQTGVLTRLPSLPDTINAVVASINARGTVVGLTRNWTGGGISGLAGRWQGGTGTELNPPWGATRRPSTTTATSSAPASCATKP